MDVRIENLTKSFGPNKAVDNVSFEVEDNSFFTILGPTGHGKTTLLRLIAGVEEPDQGRIYLNGEDVTDVSPQERDITMVFQNFALYRNMSVYGNIAAPIESSNKKLSSGEVDKKIHEKARAVGIEHLLDRDTKQLSGGEQQRTALARALAQEAGLVLLDEPLTNLDYKLREKMRIELKELEFGVVIHATSEPLTAMSVCSHIAIIKNGRIQQCGESSYVYDNPKNTTVGEFYSEPPMNFLDAELIEEDEEYYLKVSDELILEVSWLKEKLDNKKYILGVRAGKFSDKEKRGMIPITGKIFEIESKGSESIIYLDYEGSILNVVLEGIIDREVGEEMKLFINPENMYVFDRKSKNMISKYKKVEGSKSHD